jgi:hypothetical protein
VIAGTLGAMLNGQRLRLTSRPARAVSRRRPASLVERTATTRCSSRGTPHRWPIIDRYLQAAFEVLNARTARPATALLTWPICPGDIAARRPVLFAPPWVQAVLSAHGRADWNRPRPLPRHRLARLPGSLHRRADRSRVSFSHRQNETDPLLVSS